MFGFSWTFALALAATLHLSSAQQSPAQDPIAAPTGPVVLTITGDVAAANGAETVLLDLDMLRSMPATNFTTTTIWTDGPQNFTGVELATFVKALGLTGSTLKVTALNDYVIEIPMTDAIAGGPILAYEQNGRELSIREKGPLWVVYPFDQHREYQTEVIYTRSIWQVDRIDVLP